MDGDSKRRPGDVKFVLAGPGHASARHCMPGQHHVGNQTGSKKIMYRGVKVWCCGACFEAREAKRLAKEQG